MKTLPLAVLILTLLIGCTTPTPYQRIGTSEDGGYSSTALGNDGYSVTFTGNSSTKSPQVYDFALLRCAELAVEGGYDSFVITHERDLAPLMVPAFRRIDVRPRIIVGIRCFSNGATTLRGKAYKASDVIRDLKAKYNIK